MTRPVPRPAGTPSLAAALLALLVGAMLAATLSGCGKKGDPLPPIRQIPAATKDLTAIQRGDRLLLSLPYPRATAAGTPLSAVSEITLWQLQWEAPATTDGTPPAMDERQFIAGARPERMLSGKDLEAAVRGDRVELETPLPTAAPKAPPATTEPAESTGAAESTEKAPPPGQPMVTLAVKAEGPTGEESGLSNLVSFAVAPAPDPPTGLEVEGMDRGVRVQWEYPEAAEETPATDPAEEAQDAKAGEAAATEGQDAAATEEKTDGADTATESDGASGDASDDESGPGVLGFNVYRRLATEREYGAPVRTVGRRVRALVDESALFGQRYIYTVTAVGQREPVLVESRFGEEAEVDYRDRFAPPAPTGVVALVQQAEPAQQATAGAPEALQVRIVWRPVEASDLAGYRVYRRSPASQEFQRISEESLTDTALVDGDVTSGASYTYRVTAVDRNGNESEPSEQVTARVR